MLERHLCGILVYLWILYLDGYCAQKSCLPHALSLRRLETFPVAKESSAATIIKSDYGFFLCLAKSVTDDFSTIICRHVDTQDMQQSDESFEEVAEVEGNIVDFQVSTRKSSSLLMAVMKDRLNVLFVVETNGSYMGLTALGPIGVVGAESTRLVQNRDRIAILSSSSRACKELEHDCNVPQVEIITGNELSRCTSSDFGSSVAVTGWPFGQYFYIVHALKDAANSRKNHLKIFRLDNGADPSNCHLEGLETLQLSKALCDVRSLKLFRASGMYFLLVGSDDCDSPRSRIGEASRNIIAMQWSPITGLLDPETITELQNTNNVRSLMSLSASIFLLDRADSDSSIHCLTADILSGRRQSNGADDPVAQLSALNTVATVPALSSSSKFAALNNNDGQIYLARLFDDVDSRSVELNRLACENFGRQSGSDYAAQTLEYEPDQANLSRALTSTFSSLLGDLSDIDGPPVGVIATWLGDFHDYEDAAPLVIPLGNSSDNRLQEDAEDEYEEATTPSWYTLPVVYPQMVPPGYIPAQSAPAYEIPGYGAFNASSLRLQRAYGHPVITVPVLQSGNGQGGIRYEKFIKTRPHAPVTPPGLNYASRFLRVRPSRNSTNTSGTFIKVLTSTLWSTPKQPATVPPVQTAQKTVAGAHRKRLLYSDDVQRIRYSDGSRYEDEGLGGEAPSPYASGPPGLRFEDADELAIVNEIPIQAPLPTYSYQSPAIRYDNFTADEANMLPAAAYGPSNQGRLAYSEEPASQPLGISYENRSIEAMPKPLPAYGFTLVPNMPRVRYDNGSVDDSDMKLEMLPVHGSPFTSNESGIRYDNGSLAFPEQVAYRTVPEFDVSEGLVAGIRFKNGSEVRGFRFHDTSYHGMYDAVARIPASILTNPSATLSAAAMERKGKPLRWDDKYGINYRDTETTDTGSEAATMTTLISGDGMQHSIPGTPQDFQPQTSQALNFSMYGSISGYDAWPSIRPVRYDDGALTYGEGIRYNRSDAYATFVKIPQRDYIPTEYLIDLQPVVPYDLPLPLVEESSAPVLTNGSNRIRYDQKRFGKKGKGIKYTNESSVNRPRAVVPKRERSPRLFYLNGTELPRRVAETVTLPSTLYGTVYGIRYGNDISLEEAKKGIRSSTADSEITPTKERKIKQKAVARRVESLVKDGLHYENSTAVALPGGGILYAEKSTAWSPNNGSQPVSSTQVSTKKKPFSRKKYPQAILKRRPVINQTKTAINATSTNSTMDGIKFEEYYNKTKHVATTTSPTNKSEIQLTLTPEIVVTSPWQPSKRLRGVRYGDNFMANLSAFDVDREDYPALRRVRFTQTDADLPRMTDIAAARYEPMYEMQAPSPSQPHGKPIRYNETYGISAVYGRNVLSNDSARPVEVAVAGQPSFIASSPIRYNNVTDQEAGYENLRPFQAGISSSDALDSDYVETKDSAVVVNPGAQRLYYNRTLQSHTVNVIDYDETKPPTLDLGHAPADKGIGMQYFTPTWLAADGPLSFGMQETGIAYPKPLSIRHRQAMSSADYEESRRVIDGDMNYDENSGPYGSRKAPESNHRVRYNETLRNGSLVSKDGVPVTVPKAPLPSSGYFAEDTQQVAGLKYDDELHRTESEDIQPPVQLPLVSISRYDNSATKENHSEVPVVRPVGVFSPPGTDVRVYGSGWERPSSNQFFAERYNSTQDELAQYPAEFPTYTDAHGSGMKEAPFAQYYGSGMTKVPQAYAEKYNVSLSDADYPEPPSVAQYNQFEILPISTVLPLREPFTRQFEGKPRRPFKRRYNESKDETDLLTKTPSNVQAVPFVLPARRTYNQSLDNRDYDEILGYRVAESVEPEPLPRFPVPAPVVFDATALAHQSPEHAFGFPYNYSDAVQHAEELNPASAFAGKYNSSLNNGDYSESLTAVKPSYMDILSLPTISPDQQTTVSRWETAPRRSFERRHNVSKDELELTGKLAISVQPAVFGAISTVRPRTAYNQSLSDHDYDELTVFRSENAARIEVSQSMPAPLRDSDGLAAPLQTRERVSGFPYDHSDLLRSDATGAFQRKYNFSLMDEDYGELERIPVAQLPIVGTARMDEGTASENRAKSERPVGRRPFKSRYNKTKGKTVRPSSTTTRKPDRSIQPVPQPVSSAYLFRYGERPETQQFRQRYNESDRKYVSGPHVAPQTYPVDRPVVPSADFPVMEPMNGTWERPEGQRPFSSRYNISTDGMLVQQPAFGAPGQPESAHNRTLRIAGRLSPPLGFYADITEHGDGRWERPDGARAFPSRYNFSAEISSMQQQLLGGQTQYEPMHNRTVQTLSVDQPPFPVDGFPVWMEAKWERPDSTRPLSSRNNTSTETTTTERHLYREPQHGLVQHEALQMHAADRSLSVGERPVLESWKQIWERPDGSRQFLERYNTSTETTPVEQLPFAGSGQHELPFNRMPRMFSMDEPQVLQGEFPAMESMDGKWERPDGARQFLDRYNTSTESTPIQQQFLPSQQRPVPDKIPKSPPPVGISPSRLVELSREQTSDGKAERPHEARPFSGRYNTSTEATPAQQKPFVWQTQYEPTYSIPGGSVVPFPASAILPDSSWHSARPDGTRPFLGRYNAGAEMPPADQKQSVWPDQYQLTSSHSGAPLVAYPGGPFIPSPAAHAGRPYGDRSFVSRYNVSELAVVQQSQYGPVQYLTKFGVPQPVASYGYALPWHERPDGNRAFSSRYNSTDAFLDAILAAQQSHPTGFAAMEHSQAGMVLPHPEFLQTAGPAYVSPYAERPGGVRPFSPRYNHTGTAAREGGVSLLPGQPLAELVPLFATQSLQSVTNTSLQGASPYHEKPADTRAFVRRYNHSEALVIDASLFQQEHPGAEFFYPSVDPLLPAYVGQNVWERPDGSRPFSARYNATEPVLEYPPFQPVFAASAVRTINYSSSQMSPHAPAHHNGEKPDGVWPFSARYNATETVLELPSQYQPHQTQVPLFATYGYLQSLPETGKGERRDESRLFSSRYNNSAELTTATTWPAWHEPVSSHTGAPLVAYPGGPFVRSPAVYEERPYGNRSFVSRYNISEPTSVQQSQYGPAQYHPPPAQLGIPYPFEPYAFTSHERSDGNRPFSSRYNATEALSPFQQAPPVLLGMGYPQPGLIPQLPVEQYAMRHGERSEGRQHFSARHNHSDASGLLQELRAAIPEKMPFLLGAPPLAHPESPGYEHRFGERPDGKQEFPKRYNTTGAILAPHDVHPAVREIPNLVPGVPMVNTEIIGYGAPQGERPESGRPFKTRYNHTEDTPTYVRPYRAETDKVVVQPGLAYQGGDYNAAMHSRPDGSTPFAARFNASEESSETQPRQYSGFVSAPYQSVSAPFQASDQFNTWEKPDGFRAFHTRYNESAQYPSAPSQYPAQLSTLPGVIHNTAEVYEDRLAQGERPEGKRPFSSRFNGADVLVTPSPQQAHMVMDHSQLGMGGQFPRFDFVQPNAQYGERPEGRQQFPVRFNHTDADVRPHDVSHVGFPIPSFSEVTMPVASLAPEPTAYQPWLGERPEEDRSFVSRFNHSEAMPTDMRVFQGDAARLVQQPMFPNMTLGLSMQTVQRGWERPDGTRPFGVRYNASEQTLVIQPLSQASFVPPSYQNVSVLAPIHTFAPYEMWEKPDGLRPFSARYNSSDEYPSGSGQHGFRVQPSQTDESYGVPSYWIGEQPDGTRQFLSRFNFTDEGVSDSLIPAQAPEARFSPMVAVYPVSSPYVQHLLPSAKAQPGYFLVTESVYGPAYGERPHGMRRFTTRFNHTDAQEGPSVHERVPFGGLVPSPVTPLVQSEIDRLSQNVQQYGERPEGYRPFAGRFNHSEAIAVDAHPPQQQDDRLLTQPNVVRQEMNVVPSVLIAHAIWERPYGSRPYITRYNATAPVQTQPPVQQLASAEPTVYPMNHSRAQAAFQAPVFFDTWERPDDSRAFSSRYNQSEQLPLVALPALVGVVSYDPLEIPSQRLRHNSMFPEDHFDVTAEVAPQEGPQFAHLAPEDAFLNWGPVTPALSHLPFDANIPLWERPDGARPFVSRFNHTERRDTRGRMTVHPVQRQPQNQSFLQAEPEATVPQQDKTSFVPVRIIADKPDEFRPFKIRYNQTHILDIPDAFVETLSHAVGQGHHISFVPPQNVVPQASPSTHQAERSDGNRLFLGHFNQTDMADYLHEFQQGLLQITSAPRQEYSVSHHVKSSFVPETWAAAHGPERPDGPRPFVGRFNRTEMSLVPAHAEPLLEGRYRVLQPSRPSPPEALPQIPVDAHRDLGWSRPERPDGVRPFVGRFDLTATPGAEAQPDTYPREMLPVPDHEVPQIVQPGWLEMSVPDPGRHERPDGVRPFVGRFNRTEISPAHIQAEVFQQWQYPIVNLSQMTQPEPVAQMPIDRSKDMGSSRPEKPEGIRPFVNRFDRTAAPSLESQSESSRQERLHIPSGQRPENVITQNVQQGLLSGISVPDSHRAERPDGIRLFVNRYNLTEIRPTEVQSDLSRQGGIFSSSEQREDMKSTEVSVTFQPQLQMPSMMPTPGAERPDGKQSFSSRYNRTSPEKPNFRGFAGKYNESLPLASYTKIPAKSTPKPVIKLTRPTVTVVHDVGERPSGARKFAGRYNVTETEIQNKSIITVRKQTKLPKKAAFRQRYNKTLPEGEHEEITAAATSLPLNTAYDLSRFVSQQPSMDVLPFWPSEEIPPTAPQYEHHLLVGESPDGSRVYVTRYNGTETERRDGPVMPVVSPVDQTQPPRMVAVRHQYNNTLPEEDHEETLFATTAAPVSTAYSRVSSRAPIPLVPAEKHQIVQIPLYENGPTVGERVMDGAFSHRYNQSKVEEPFQIQAPAQSGFVPRYDLSVLAEDYEDRAILTSTNKTQLFPLTDEHVQSELGRPAMETPSPAQPLPVIPLRVPALERKSEQHPILVAVSPTQQVIATQLQEPVPEIYHPAQHWSVPVMHPYSEVVRGVDPNRYGIVRNATGDMLFEEDTTIAFREDERRIPYQPSVQIPVQLEPPHFLPGPLNGLFQPEMQPMFVNGSLMRRVEDQRFTSAENFLGGTFEMQPPLPWQFVPRRNDTLSPPMPPPQVFMPVPYAAPYMSRTTFQQGRVPQSLPSQGQAGPSPSGRQGKKFKTDVSLLRPLMPSVSGSQHTGIQADIRSPSYALPTRKTFKRLPTTPVDWTRSTTRITAKTTLPPSNPNIPRLKKILYGKPNAFMQGLGSAAQSFNQPPWNFTAQPQPQYLQPDTRYDLRSPLSHVAPLSAYAARPVPALPSNNITSQFFGTNQTQTGCCGNSTVGDGSVIDILINKSGVRSLLDSVKINMSASASRDETTSYSVKLQLVQLPAVSLDSICSTSMTVESQKTKKEVDCSARDISEAGVGIGVKSGSGSFHYEILNTADSLDGSRFVVDESNGYLYPKVPFRRNAPTKNRFFVGPNKAYNVLVQVTDTICDTTETAKLTITFVCTSSHTESPSYKTTQN